MKQETIFLNPDARYEEMKPYIIDEFTLIYGEEYREYITKKLNNTLCVLSSDPITTYEYALSHQKNIKSKTLKDLKDKYNKYVHIQAVAKKYAKDKFKLYLIEKGFLPSSLASSKTVLDSFMDSEFGVSLVDSFDSYCSIMLNEADTPSYEKNSITSDRNKYLRNMAQLGIDDPLTEPEKVDDLIYFREELKSLVLKKIVELSTQTQEIKSKYKSLSGIEIKDTVLYKLLFKTVCNEETVALQTRYNNNDETYSFIYAPLIELYKTNLSLDGLLIHELTHAIESDKDLIGIIELNKNKNNEYLNEMRTERIAAKVTASMHSKGHRIFDSVKREFNYNLNTNYSLLFPIIGEFLDENERLFNECAITHDLTSLYEKYTPEYIEMLSDKLQYEMKLVQEFYRKNGIKAKYESNTDLMDVLHKGKAK